MNLKVFSIYDAKAGAFNQPFFMHTFGQAERAFRDEVDSPTSLISKHPEDFTLFDLGVFDDSTGLITPHTAPVSVLAGLDCVSRGQATNN